MSDEPRFLTPEEQTAIIKALLDSTTLVGTVVDRNAIIEECGQRLDMMANISSNSMRQDDLREAAAAIRALKQRDT